MQPNSKLELSEHSFDRLKYTIRNAVEMQRQRKAFQLGLPETIGVKLTNRCNLRCIHCYQWNDSGYHQEMARAEQALDLDVRLFEELLKETRPMKSRLYLWGGEPLIHREIGRILVLLEQDPRETTICTNGHFIGRHLDALCRISANLEFLIALEGFEKEHDTLRGNGSFSRVMRQIDELLKLRSNGVFKGKVSIHTVINDSMVGNFYELMEYYEAKGIDLVILCFPWYISEETSREMDGFVAENFDWIDVGKGRHSWDAFKYRIDPQNIGVLVADLKRINSRTWKTRIRYQPGLEFDEIEPFIRGNSMIARCATSCSVLNTRVDVTPTGNVSACKFFSEFSTVGNLHSQSLAEIWQSETYNKIRQVLGHKLSPACSKCSVLYLHAHSTPIHI